MQNRAKLLDEVIPLDGVSHADVVGYSIDIPMRYTECCALLADGRKARLRDSRQFLGYCEDGETVDLVFDGENRRIEIRVERSKRAVREIVQWQKTGTALNGAGRKIVTRDGSLAGVRLTERLAAKDAEPVREFETHSLDPYPEWLALRNRAASIATH